jgi:hypothetical protein
MVLELRGAYRLEPSLLLLGGEVFLRFQGEKWDNRCALPSQVGGSEKKGRGDA